MQGNNGHIYRVENIEIHTSQLCLKRGGRELQLRRKTFQVLVFLLEQRERVVTKEELFERIWSDTAVTDNALEQCLVAIRKALGDDSRHPRFIKTIPRIGYRFIGPVEEMGAGEPGGTEPKQLLAAEEEAATALILEADSPSRPPKPLRQWIGQHPGPVLLAAFLIAISATGLVWIKRRSAAPQSLVSVILPQDVGRRPVAVMFFDNRTGNADLNWLREGLADMLITDLSRANNLTVLSREQLHVLLERSGHNANDRITLGEALDVSRRSQAKIVILGSFARIDEKIRIDVQLHDARDGQLLAAERLLVDRPAEILTQVDLLSLKLASHLGTPNGEQNANAGLTSVMTKDLEAYRYYSLAVEKAQALHNHEAIALLQKAVALDPQFAMAYARIGYAYAVTDGFFVKGKPYLEKAYHLSDRLTEKDKLYIAGWYSIASLDYPAAITSFREIISHYPLEAEAYARLARLLRGEERVEEAQEIAKQGLVIDAGAKDLYNTLGTSYSELGRNEEALAMYARYVELAPNEPNAHDSLGLGYQCAGRYPEAIQEYERALDLKSDFAIAMVHLGNARFQQGRYREAIKQFEHYTRTVATDAERERGYNSIALVHLEQQKLDEAGRVAGTATRSDKGSANVLNVLFAVSLRRNDLRSAQSFQKLIESQPPTERGARGSMRFVLYSRGALALKSGRTNEAIEDFKEALKHHPSIWYIDHFEDCLANAYLELGQYDEAIAEYERILRLNPNYPRVHYYLGQAYERKDDLERARAEYQKFLDVWRDADPDIPAVIAARQALVEKPDEE